MSKYIIKNCPAYREEVEEIMPEITCKKIKNACFKKPMQSCKDITDCLLKQIVDECKEQNLKYDTTACSVLQLLEIEEVMSKDKTLSNMTEAELRNLIKEVIIEMNNFRDVGEPFYFPSYIGDGLPPELRTDRTYATDHTEMRKG